MTGSWLPQNFPNLNCHNCRVTSPTANRYNCIAWAADSTTKWWWPDKGGFWPKGVPKETTVCAFEKAFNTLRYERCLNGNLEDGYEKIVLYAKIKNQLTEPTHAAKQLKCGHWTSKLGPREDIVHNEVKDLTGPAYGDPVLYMKRKPKNN